MKKQVLVSVDRGETRVALLEASGQLAARKSAAKSSTRRRRRPAKPAAGYHVAELYLERRGARSIVGNIYKGRVDNVLGGLEAAFVDIGLEKNGFLHVDEIVLPGVEAPRRGRGSGRENRQITDMLKPGQEIVVQVVKDPLKTKGARLSMDLTIAGRYMVYAPFGEGVGVSRRLDDGERERLRKEAAKLDLKGAGAIIRTAAQGATRADLERELLYLFKLNEVLQKRVEETAAPALVFQEADLSVYVAAGFAILFFAGTSWKQLTAVVLLFVFAILLVLVILPATGHHVLKPYQMQRLTGFLHPSHDVKNQTYNILQSLTAIGSGGKTGLGVHGATQVTLGYLPAPNTDFIFAVVGETYGFVGAAVVLSLYALLIWRALRILTMAKNLYGTLIAGGVLAMLMFQVFVNAGMTIGIMPITGVPLPLLSYGGSSVLVTFIAIGLLQSIYIQARITAVSKSRGIVS